MHYPGRPSISLIPLVHDHDNLSEPPGHDTHNTIIDAPPKRYLVPRRAVILSVVFFIVLMLLAIFVALFTSFVQAQESAAAVASSAAASETPL